MMKNSIQKLSSLFLIFLFHFYTVAALGSELHTLESYPMDNRNNASIILDNGMVVVLISDENVKNSSISISLPVGSFFEPEDQPGLARLHQMMLLSNSKNYPEEGGLIKLVEDFGGENTSRVSGGMTNLSFSIENSFFNTLISQLVDMIENPVFDMKKVKLKLRSLHSEWYQLKNSSDWARFHLLSSLAGKHQVNHFILGNLKTLTNNAKVLEGLQKYHDKHYSSNVMKVVILSNKPIDDMINTAKEKLGKITNKNLDMSALYSPVNVDAIGGHSITIKSNAKKNKLIIDIPVGNITTIYAHKLHVLFRRLILDSQYGTAYRWLMDNGLIDNINIDILLWPGDEGFIELTIDLTKDGILRKKEVLGAIIDYVKLIKEKGVGYEYYQEITEILKLDSLVYKPKDTLQYIHDTAEKMQFYPLEHILLSDCYIAEYNQQIIDDFISNINIDNLILFNHDTDTGLESKMPYFDHLYKVEPFHPDTIRNQSDEVGEFHLPLVNKYIPNDFYVNSLGEYTKPTFINYTGQVDVWYMSSAMPHYPVGATNIHFHIPDGYDDVASEAFLSLLIEMLYVQSDTLISHAKDAINDISFYNDSGLRIMVHGIPNKQLTIISDILTIVKQKNTEKEFATIAQSYITRLKERATQSLSRKSFDILNAIRMSKNFKTDDLIEKVQSISVEQFNQFVDDMFNSYRPRIFNYGSYSQSDLTNIASCVNEMLSHEQADKVSAEFSYTKLFKPAFPESYVVMNDSVSDEGSMLDAYIDYEGGNKSKAATIMLVMMIKTDLNKKDSLGIKESNVSIAYREFGDFPSISLFVSGAHKNMHELMNSIDTFKKQMFIDLERMDYYSFEAIKSDVLSQVDSTVESLDKDLSYHVSNWLQNIPDEKVRVEVIRAIESVRLDDIKDLQRRLFSQDKSSRVNIQYRGKNNKDKCFHTLENSVDLVGG